MVSKVFQQQTNVFFLFGCWPKGDPLRCRRFAILVKRLFFSHLNHGSTSLPPQASLYINTDIFSLDEGFANFDSSHVSVKLEILIESSSFTIVFIWSIFNFNILTLIFLSCKLLVKFWWLFLFRDDVEWALLLAWIVCSLSHFLVYRAAFGWLQCHLSIDYGWIIAAL